MKPFLFNHLPETTKQITAYGFARAQTEEKKEDPLPEITQALRAKEETNVRK
jgi:hypothetical protein